VDARQLAIYGERACAADTATEEGDDAGGPARLGWTCLQGQVSGLLAFSFYFISVFFYSFLFSNSWVTCAFLQNVKVDPNIAEQYCLSPKTGLGILEFHLDLILFKMN
jgi:hypothetical protein